MSKSDLVYSPKSLTDVEIHNAHHYLMPITLIVKGEDNVMVVMENIIQIFSPSTQIQTFAACQVIQYSHSCKILSASDTLTNQKFALMKIGIERKNFTFPNERQVVILDAEYKIHLIDSVRGFVSHTVDVSKYKPRKIVGSMSVTNEIGLVLKDDFLIGQLTPTGFFEFDREPISANDSLRFCGRYALRDKNGIVSVSDGEMNVLAEGEFCDFRVADGNIVTARRSASNRAIINRIGGKSIGINGWDRLWDVCGEFVVSVVKKNTIAVCSLENTSIKKLFVLPKVPETGILNVVAQAHHKLDCMCLLLFSTSMSIHVLIPYSSLFN